MLVNIQASAFTLFLEHLDLAAVYALFLHPVLHAFLEEIGKYFMFPFAAAANAVLSVLAWRQFYLDRSTSSAIHAAVQTAAAIAISIAVIGALVATAIFSLATPIIFTATLGAKALYHAGVAFYSLFKSTQANTPEEKEIHLKAAKAQGISALAGLMATAAVACVFLFGKLAVAALGLGVSIFLAGYAAYIGISAYRASRAIAAESAAEESSDDTTLDLLKSFDETPEKRATNTAHMPPTFPLNTPAPDTTGTATATLDGAEEQHSHRLV